MRPEEEFGQDGEAPPGLAALVARAGAVGPARPVTDWNPPDCGEIDMRISADGVWHYQGSPIAREGLVRLFASILRREPDGRHVLVTPVEKVGIQVEDAPFLAVEFFVENPGPHQILTFRTNVGDVVAADAVHPIRFAEEHGTSGLKAYLLVRGGLEAVVSRATMFELIDLATEEDGKLGLRSGGAFFALPAGAHG